MQTRRPYRLCSAAAAVLGALGGRHMRSDCAKHASGIGGSRVQGGVGDAAAAMVESLEYPLQQATQGQCSGPTF